MADWLDDAADEVPTSASGSVKEIADAAMLLADLRKEEERLETQGKELKERIRKLEQETIPDLLNAAGVSAVKITGLGEVSAKLNYKASIPEGAWQDFVNWANTRGYGDVLKESTVVQNASPEVKEELRALGAEFETKPNMHWQTLSKIAREQAAEGNDFPPCLNVFKYYQTNIKR